MFISPQLITRKKDQRWLTVHKKSFLVYDGITTEMQCHTARGNWMTAQKMPVQLLLLTVLVAADSSVVTLLMTSVIFGPADVAIAQQEDELPVFPPPDWDSDWVEILQNQVLILDHDLDVDPEHMFVDIITRDVAENINEGDLVDGFPEVIWTELTEDAISVQRSRTSAFAREVRVRIWVYEVP